MKTNSSNWVNGSYYLAKRAYKLANSVGGNGPFGYLTMQEIAQLSEETRNNRWTGYWESPRGAWGCTFKAVKLTRHMPMLFIPLTYMDILALGSQAGYETGIARAAYARSAERHYGRVATGDPSFVKLMRMLNAPLTRLQESRSALRAANPSTDDESVMTCLLGSTSDDVPVMGRQPGDSELHNVLK